jgi:hypothetical protein
VTAAPGSEDRSPWFHRVPAPGHGKAESEEARRWHELAEARERFVRHLRGGEGEAGCPAPDPDVAVGFWSPTPVLGFRFWYVFSGCLQGVRQTWLRPELEARCALRGSRGAPHAGGGCRCGIYALKAPEGLPRSGRVKMRPGAGIAYGLVALSGVVVEHEHGYRAARAEAVAAAVLFRGRAVCGADRWWIKRLFQRPDCALEEAEKGVWPRVKVMVPSAEEVVRFLRGEVSRLEGTWTSASRSG